jgi:hypothetical protein
MPWEGIIFTASGSGRTVMRITAMGDGRHGVLPAQIIKGQQDEASAEREHRVAFLAGISSV